MNLLLSLLGLVGVACARPIDERLPAESPASASPAAELPATQAASSAPAVAPAEPAEPAAAVKLPPVVRGRNGEAPLYVLVFTHHYRGLGGYYPASAEVRETAQACIDQDMARYCTLFFDGLLAGRLAQEDPSLAGFLREHGFPIGYHGEEAHGPYPVVVSVEGLGRREGGGMPQLVESGWSFQQAVDAIHTRYTHGFRGATWGADGYLLRGAGGQTDPDTSGGIRRVEEWLGVEPSYTPGHAFFQPAALPALEQEAAGMVLQGAGTFAPHFLRNTRDEALIQATSSFLGAQTSLFWFMGHLVEKGTPEAEIPMWSDEGFATRSGGGGPGGSGARPPRDGGGPPPGARRGDGPPPGARGGPPRGGGRAGGGAPGEAVQSSFGRLDRGMPRLVQLKIDGTRQSASDFLAWVRDQQARDPSIVFVSPAELHQYVEPLSITLPAADVAQAVLATGAGDLPDALVVNGQATSHADAFEVLARSLAGEGTTVTTTGVNGPVGAPGELVTATGRVTAAEVVAAAPAVRDAIEASPWRAIPTTVQVGGQTVGFHQYHRLMAQVVLNGAEGELDLPAAGYVTAYGRLLGDRLDPEPANQLFWMQTQLWTVRPVTWRQ